MNREQTTDPIPAEFAVTVMTIGSSLVIPFNSSNDNPRLFP